MKEKITRRDFLSQTARTSAAIGMLALFTPSRVFGANDRLSVGIVGPGQRGRSLMEEFQKIAPQVNAELTAVCDIWTKNLDRAVEMVTRWTGRPPRRFRTFEDMLAWEGLDAVIIATADFQHAKMLVQAVKAGKDVYVEKPMANTLEDAKKALSAVKESGRIVQVGTQRRSDGRHQAAAELLRTGVLGKICRVEVSWNYFGPRWRRGDVNEVREQDTDWKRFLMGKRYRPFNPSQYMEWRLYRDFSSGIPDQWMSHMIDVVHWFTGSEFPLSAVAHGGVYVWKDGRENEDTFHALLEYPEGFLVSYSTTFGNSAGDSFTIHGTQGTFDANKWIITGAGGGGKGQLKESIPIPSHPGVSHLQNFLECVRSRKTPNAPVEAGYSASVAVILAVQALLKGRKVYFDRGKQEMKV